MAPAKTAPAEPEVEEEGGLRSQMFKHEAQVEYINEEYGVDLDTLSAAEIIAYAYATRVAWRKTDTYRNLVEAHKGEAAAEAAAKKAEREAAAKARAEAKAAKAAEAAAAPAAPAQKATKATAAKKAQKAAAPTKATRATKASKAAASGDNPFD